MGWSLSVDYGTTNTTAAIRPDDGDPRAVRLGPEAIMPSAVLLTSGGIQVGEAALEGRRTAPEYFVASPKLLLGQDAVLLGDTEVDITRLVGATLSAVLAAAVSEAGGSQPDKVILTHPQTWAGPRRAALEAAWKRTGARAPVQMVSEPIAAVSWFAETDTLPEGARVAVLDFGGGTCDVAVLHHGKSGRAPLEITAHAGLEDLGGSTLDHVFALWVRSQIRAQGLTELDDALNERRNLNALHALYDSVTAAKHRLADWEYADVNVAVDGESTSVTVTINEFNQIVDAELERARALLERSIAAAGIEPKDLHGLYLTGGSSRLRWVHQMAAELLDGRPANLAEPHLVVALGAHAATSVKVVERAGAETSRFITLRGLQANPGRARSVSLPPPQGAPVAMPPPMAPPGGGPPRPGDRAAPPGRAARPSGPPAGPPLRGPAPGSSRPDGPVVGGAERTSSVAAALLSAHPALASATQMASELRAFLDREAVQVALLSVPGLLDQVAQHPALLTVGSSDGRPRVFTAPDDPESATLPARLFFADAPAWRARFDDPSWQRSFVTSRQGGPIWAYGLVRTWAGLSSAERSSALDDPEWSFPLPGRPDWIERSPGRLSVTVEAPAARPSGGASGPGFQRPRAASSAQNAVLDALSARGCFEQGEGFRERLNAARDPRLPARRAGVGLFTAPQPVDYDIYLFPGGRHRRGGGAPDIDLPAYVLLLPTRSARTTQPLLVLTRDLVGELGSIPGRDVSVQTVQVALTREVGSDQVQVGSTLRMRTRDPGLGVELARTLDRPWNPRR